MGDTLRQIASVFKLRIGGAILMSALAGLAVTPGEMPAAWRLAVLAVAVLLSAGAAGAINHVAERDLDARMRRTRRRPFVTGRFRVGLPWLFVIALTLAAGVGLALYALNGFVALHLLLGALVYGVVYTLILKRRTPLNIVIGGLSGSFAVLAGAAAIDPSPRLEPLILAGVLFLWTPPHFWSLAIVHRDDYAAAGVPMMPVVAGNRTTAWLSLGHVAGLVALSVVPTAFGMSWLYLAGALAGGLYFMSTSVALVRRPGPDAARRNFRASLLQLTLLIVGALLDRAVLGP